MISPIEEIWILLLDQVSYVLLLIYIYIVKAVGLSSSLIGNQQW